MEYKIIEAYSIFEEVSSKLANGIENLMNKTDIEIYSPEENNPDISSLLGYLEENPEYSTLFEPGDNDPELEERFYKEYNENAEISKDRFMKAIEDVKDFKEINKLDDKYLFNEQITQRRRITPYDVVYIQKNI